MASNVTNAVETTGWRSEPPTRGTFRLLLSCIVTLSLCVYTAVHLNIPQAGTSKSAIYNRKFGWVMRGIFAPELVVYTAWGQWHSAKKLTAKINELLDRQVEVLIPSRSVVTLFSKPQKSQNPSISDRKYPWTMVHSFYAGMGGFVIDTNDSHLHPYIPGSPRLSVTAQGVAILAEHGHLPDISQEFINDKNKADHIAKTLAIIQVSWLLIECIARVATRLPLTLLEINTLAHVMCAIIMYIMWMNKPYDIHEPLALTGDWVRPLCATMWMFSRISTLKKEEGRHTFFERQEIERIIQVDAQSIPASNNGNIVFFSRMGHGTSSTSFSSRADVERVKNGPPDSRDIEAGDVAIEMDGVHTLIANEPENISPSAAYPGDLQILNIVSGEITKCQLLSTDTGGVPHHLKLRENEIVREFGFGPKPESLHFRKRNVSHGITPRWYEPRVELEPNPTTLTRWKLALSVMQDHHELWEQYRARYVFKDTLVNSSKFLHTGIRAWEYPASLLNDNFVDPEIPNWPGKDLLGQAHTLVPIAVLSLATACYGGLHAAAWHSYFPTPLEQHCWRLSAVYIAVSGASWSIVSLASEYHSIFNLGIGKLPDNWFGKAVKIIFLTLSVLAAASVAFMYLFARPFLVFEAFLSLRRLPVDAYKTPVFTQFFPHL